MAATHCSRGTRRQGPQVILWNRGRLGAVPEVIHRICNSRQIAEVLLPLSEGLV